jgi:hypothetical protein
LHAIVEPRRRGFSIDQLVDDTDESWIEEVRDRQLHAPTTEPSDGNPEPS